MSITLSNLKALGRWPEALELAIQTKPEEVECLLPKAGDAYLIRGDYAKLNVLLESLPEPYKTLPETLFWRFRTAYRLRKDEPMLEIVQEILVNHEAPNLRAFYASHYLQMPEKLAEIKKAKALEESHFIQYLYALALAENKLEEAITDLEATCIVAKTSENHFNYLQSKNLLGYLYGSQGRFRASLGCFDDLLDVAQRSFQIDWQFYLSNCNNLLYNQILVNRLEDAEKWVGILSNNLEHMQTDVTFNARATLGDYWLAKGVLAKALYYHQKNFEDCQKLNLIKNLIPGTLLLNYLKLLLKTGQNDLAQALLNNQTLSQREISADLLIAQALYFSNTDSLKVIELLTDINHQTFGVDAQIVCLTLQAHAFLQMGKTTEVNALLRTRPITDLSIEGFRVLLASSAFDAVYNYWLGNDLLPILGDPKAFDNLANDESDWHRLSLLKHFSGHIERCRYAQYLYSQNQFQNALEVIKVEVNKTPNLLSQSIYMSILLSIGNIKGFEKMLDIELTDEPSLLNSEGRMRMYEAIAGYLYTHRNEPRLAQKYLHWEQAIAFELGLSRRQQIISMLLEEVNTALGESVVLEPINFKGLKNTLQQQVRQRFDSLMSECNVEAAMNLCQIGYISNEEVRLIEGLKAYRDAESGMGSLVAIAHLLSKYQPTNPEAQLYWSLLLLQLYSKIGSVTKQTELKYILAMLEHCAVTLPNLDFFLPFTARIFPLGLALVSHLLDSFKSAYMFVFMLIDDPKKGGIYKAGEKLASLPPLVREALIQDGLCADNKAFQEAVSSKTGYTINKARFEKSLEKVGLKDYEFTNIGALYRGLRQVENDGYITESAKHLLQQNEHLKAIVPNL